MVLPSPLSIFNVAIFGKTHTHTHTHIKQINFVLRNSDLYKSFSKLNVGDFESFATLKGSLMCAKRLAIILHGVP